MGFSRQEYWNGLPCPPPGDLPDPGIESTSLCLLHWQMDSLPLAPPGKPIKQLYSNFFKTHVFLSTGSSLIPRDAHVYIKALNSVVKCPDPSPVDTDIALGAN